LFFLWTESLRPFCFDVWLFLTIFAAKSTNQPNTT